MWQCDVTSRYPWVIPTGTGLARVWVQVQPKLPMGYPCYALRPSQAQQHYQESADSCRLPAPNLKFGQKVYMKAQFFQTTRPFKKLFKKSLGPYEIIAQTSSNSITLQLPQLMHAIHPIYHISMLELTPASSIPN